MDLYTINMAMAFSAGIIGLLLLIAAGQSGNLGQRVYRWFFVTLALNLLSIANEFAVGLVEGHAGQPWDTLIRAFDFLSYLLWALSLVAFTHYLYAYLSTRTKLGVGFVRLITVFCGCTVVLAALAQVHHWYADFDAQNHYIVQGGAWIAQIFPTLSLLVMIAVALRHRRALTSREFISLLLYFLIPLFCYAVEMVIEGFWISTLGATVALLLLYVNIQVDLERRLKDQEAQLVMQRTQIMLSQIQPHFLYNALTAISRLCEGNKGAQTALITFSEYLRGNMDSLTRDRPVTFEAELAHVRQYLWLESLRFEDRLKVVYDIRADQFMIPVLTLQPIVENAVRHGVTKVRRGGTITIRTEEAQDAYVITVADDGAGFDPSQPLDPSRSHVGLTNVRARLSALCGGRLTIDSAPGVGTTATIEIPKGARKDDHHCRRRRAARAVDAEERD